MPIIYNSNIFGQPPQALPSDKKDELWKRANMDWMEQLLKGFLPEKRSRLIKNYNVAQGVIDVEDYIDTDLNVYKNIFDGVETAMEDSLLADSDIIADDLKFYPIVPSIINVLTGELLKKFDHIKVKAVDEYSANEALEYKKQLMLQYLQQKAQAKIAQQLESQGISQDSPEFQEQMQQAVQQAMSIPEIQKFMNRNYKNNYEEWANRILEQSELKHRLKEKEIELFKHQLIADEAYSEIRIDDNDIEVINWNPYDTLVIKPKHVKYTSDADLVSRQYWTTIHDVVSKYRDKIDKALIEKYNTPLGVTPTFSERRLQPDDNQSLMLNEKKLIAFKYMMGGIELDASSKVLVTEGYWMSRRRLAKLTAIYEGVRIEKIVDDTFKITIKPVYDKDKNLIAGEELEYFYAPQVWKGAKLNFAYGSVPSTVVNENEYLDKSIFGKKTDDLNADVNRGWIYIDVEPLEYQFTDEHQPFKPKIPVVGCDGFEKNMNVGKLSLIDKTKALQVMYNGFMNEIDKFAKTEIGLFYIMDQRLIPQQSLDGTWGKYNWLKFIMTAKDSGLGVVDNSASNLEGNPAMQQPSVVNLLNNDRFKSRIELANYCEQQIMKVIGISPQRMGSINSQETATGVNQAINNSYSQTELYFYNHTNLMRELKSMILDAEKYIESKKPISRVNYLNSDVENVLFEIDTEDLLLRRFNIFLTNSTDSQRVLEQLRQLAIQNNTSGASMLDLATIIESSNVREIKDTLAASLQNFQKQEEAKRQHEQQMLQQQLEAQAAEKEKERQFIADQNERNRLKDMYIADVKATGMSRENDIDQSGINDALEVSRFNLEQEKSYSDILNKEQDRNMKQKEYQSKAAIEKEKVNLKKQEIASKERMKQMEISRDLANQKNDEKIAHINAKNRGNKK
ncbi:MAG TPA: hypothetical protein PKC06_13465 [Saprospiraceae bacterium]|jgi:hypothetical protein|nr:hypothetical protein [Saprospiraceae bacterium]